MTSQGRAPSPKAPDAASERGEESRPNPSGEAQGFGVLRTPGSGTGRPEETHTSITTTQTSSGLTAGDPGGGPHRTPERQALDAARHQAPQPRSGRDPDLTEEPTRSPEDVDATPPHGDVPGKA
jgi:hypothetical protein